MLTLKNDNGEILVDAVRVLSSSHQRTTRVSILDDLYNPLPGAVFTGTDGYAIDGSVQHDRSKLVSRSCSLTIANPDGIWTPGTAESLFYWNRLIYIERGVVLGGVPFYAPLGVFLIDTPEVVHGGGRATLQIGGSDRMDRGTRSEFTSPVSYASGSSVGAVIQDILLDAGLGSERWIIDDGGATLGATRNYEVGEDRMGAVKALASSFALDVYADANGYLVIRETPDPNDQASVWTFQEGVEATMLGLSKRWSRDRFYNHILVSGEAADQAPIRAEASDTNPASPTRVTGPMGDRLYKYTSAMITTLAQAQSVANALLFEKALIEEEIDLSHIANPLLEAGDAISIVESVTATDDKYILDSLTIPLAAGSASLQVRKVRRLS